MGQLPGAEGQRSAASSSAELPITPAQVAAVVKLVDDGKLSNKLARQVVEGVLAGEGEPDAGDADARAGAWYATTR